MTRIAAKFNVKEFARSNCPRKELDENGRHAEHCRSCADLERILNQLVQNMGIESSE